MGQKAKLVGIHLLSTGWCLEQILQMFFNSEYFVLRCLSKPPDTAGKFKSEELSKGTCSGEKERQKRQLNQSCSALLQFGSTSANTGKKLFYLHRQKVKALAGAVSGVLRSRTSGRISALKAEVAEGEASTAGSCLLWEIQCPVSSLLDIFVWQGLVLCGS